MKYVEFEADILIKIPEGILKIFCQITCKAVQMLDDLLWKLHTTGFIECNAGSSRM